MTDKTTTRVRRGSLVRAALLLAVFVLPACDNSPMDVEQSKTRAFALVPGHQQVTWDFRTTPFVSVGGVSTAAGTSTSASVTAFISQNCGGPAEDFGGSTGPVHLTRFFGEPSCYPYISVTALGTITLSELTFFHVHNHNPGYPTDGGYRTQLQINTGTGWVNIGNDVELSGATNFTQGVVNLGNQSVSGTFQLRWISTDLLYGSDTNTEFFAMYDIALTVGTNPANANACKNGGWASYGFRNQGQCVSFVNTGKDSR